MEHPLDRSGMDDLPPELRPVVRQMLDVLEPLPRDSAIVVLAIAYLMTLPEPRRRALATMILTHVLEA